MPTPTQEFDIWLFRREQTTKVVKGSQNYEDMLEHIGTFDTVERFWSLYSHIKRPSDLPSVNLSVFRKGIKPLWEDEANKKGGKFGIRVKKGISSHCHQKKCNKVHHCIDYSEEEAQTLRRVWLRGGVILLRSVRSPSIPRVIM